MDVTVCSYVMISNYRLVKDTSGFGRKLHSLTDNLREALVNPNSLRVNESIRVFLALVETSTRSSLHREQGKLQKDLFNRKQPEKIVEERFDALTYCGPSAL